MFFFMGEKHSRLDATSHAQLGATGLYMQVKSAQLAACPSLGKIKYNQDNRFCVPEKILISDLYRFSLFSRFAGGAESLPVGRKVCRWDVKFAGGT